MPAGRGAGGPDLRRHLRGECLAGTGEQYRLDQEGQEREGNAGGPDGRRSDLAEPVGELLAGLSPANFPANGQWTPAAGFTPPSPGVFAVSIPSVHPTACITWFQAEQACAASGKRLLTNQEWQRAAAGTPEGAAGDDGTTQCNTITASDAVNTGSRSACVSSYGVLDMVGNVDEWVADWVPHSTTCGSWSGSSDYQCLAGAATTGEPGALIRGGGFNFGSLAGPFTVNGNNSPSNSNNNIGFRCAR